MGTIIRSILDLQENAFFCLHDFLSPCRDVYLKLEGLSAAGSIKFKPARQMIQELEEHDIIQPGRSKIVESSSGNLGVALALVCKVQGYPFTCVTDPHANPTRLAHIRRYGGEVVVVTQRDANGGFLQTRLALIRQMLRDDRTYVWTNQYANPANPQSHFGPC